MGVHTLGQPKVTCQLSATSIVIPVQLFIVGNICSIELQTKPYMTFKIEVSCKYQRL